MSFAAVKMEMLIMGCHLLFNHAYNHMEFYGTKLQAPAHLTTGKKNTFGGKLPKTN